MRNVALSLVVMFGVLPGVAAAHDGPVVHDHALLEPGAFDRVPPRSEYSGHFLRGRVHHGSAHHGAGHPNTEAAIPRSGRIHVAADGRTFVVLVTPNLVNRASAKQTADRLSVAHCMAIPGTTRVRYDRIERHAPQQLDAWLFGGQCR